MRSPRTRSDRAPLRAIARGVSALDSETYRQFLAASFAGSLGGWVLGTAQGWLVLDLTGSSAALGLTSAAGWLPFLLVSPLAGVLADRWDANRLIVSTRLAVAGCGVALAALVTTGAVELWHVVGIALIAGCAYALAAPAMQAMVGSLVRSTEIGAAIALNSAQFNLARVVGPAIAGVALAAAGTTLAYWLAAACALTALGAFARMPIARRHRASAGPMLESLREGAIWLRARPDLLTLVLLTAAPALLVLNYGVLLPVFARDQLAVGAAGLGALAAAAGIGAFAGALLVAIGHPGGGSGTLMLGALAAMSAAVLVFSVSSWFAVSLIALAIAGGAQVVYYTTANALLQVQVPPGVLGRVLSLYAVVSQGLIPIGNLMVGRAADLSSASTALAATALLCLGVTATVAWLAPGVRSLRGRPGDGDPSSPAAEPAPAPAIPNEPPCEPEVSP